MRIECLDYIKFLKSIQNESVDLAITDPPYGISYQNNYTHNKHEIIKGDDKIFDYTSLAKELYRVLKEDTAVYCFTCWSEYPHHYKEFESVGFTMKEPLIVQKRASGKTDLYGSFQTNSEWILFAHKGRFKFRQTELVRNKRAGTIPNKGRKPVPEFKTRFPSCWFGEEFPWSAENPQFQKQYSHPTIKSEELISWLIQMSSDDGDVVIDPFLGSGTTAVAAIKNSRQILGCEIDKEFYEMTMNRIRESL